MTSYLLVLVGLLAPVALLGVALLVVHAIIAPLLWLADRMPERELPEAYR